MHVYSKPVECMCIVVTETGFALTVPLSSVVIATCASAKRLSDWAFEHGAFCVRHDYDLSLSDGEP